MGRTETQRKSSGLKKNCLLGLKVFSSFVPLYLYPPFVLKFFSSNVRSLGRASLSLAFAPPYMLILPSTIQKANVKDIYETGTLLVEGVSPS